MSPELTPTMKISDCWGVSRHTTLRKAETKGYARHKCEDVGTTHAIGRRIPLGSREGTTAPRAANGKVPDGVLLGLVVDLATLGSRYFPLVYSVVREIEGDSGFLPVEPMDGVCLANDSKELPVNKTAWTPKLRVIAEKLGQGVAISWDGPVLCHCTTVSYPDGMEGERVCGAKDSRFHNHLFGTFTAAKERIVRAAGRMLSAAQNSAPTSSGEDEPGTGPRSKKKKTKKKPRR